MIRHHMVRYFKRQSNALKKSLLMKNFIKITLIELGKYLSMLLLLMLFLFFFARILIGVLPFFTSLDQLNDLSDTPEVDAALSQVLQQKNILDLFTIRIVALTLIFALLLSIILALFNTLILDRLRNTKFQKKRLVKLFYIHSVLTIVYFTISFLLIYQLVDITSIVIMTIIFTLIYSYLIFIFKLSVGEGSIWKDVKHGLINSIRIHYIFPAFLMGILVLLGMLSICGLFVWLFGIYASIVLLLFVALWSVWITHYHDILLHKEV
jgi:hypothetical protein